MNSNSSNLNINTDRTRALLGQLYSELDVQPTVTAVDGEDLPGFGPFLAAYNNAAAAIAYRSQALAQDGAELADSLTSTLHRIESVDSDSATGFTAL